MIHILVESGYEKNNRAEKILNGIISSAKKRHEDWTVYQSVNDAKGDEGVIILISQSEAWTSGAVKALSGLGIHPLLFGFEGMDTGCGYSSISPAYTKSAYNLARYAASFGGKNFAILGYNKDSLPDRLKYTGIRQALTEAGAKYKVFENRGSIAKCIDSLLNCQEDFSDLIFCNGNTAVALYSGNREFLEGKRIYSCSALRICDFFDLPCPVCKIDYFTAGTELTRLCVFLKKEESPSPCIMSVDMYMDFPHSAEDTVHPINNTEIDFWADTELLDMERLDGMLSECDETDLAILSGIIAGETYEKSAEKLFISTNTVKYRIKKLLELSRTESRKDLISLIQKFKITI